MSCVRVCVCVRALIGSVGTGNLRLMVQSSALRAAIMEDKDEPEDGDRPMSRMEMNARVASQASRALNEVRSGL